MAREVNRGEIWMYTFGAPDKRRPVIVLSRQILLEVLQTATVVPITTTLHGSPTEVELGVEDGLKDRVLRKPGEHPDRAQAKPHTVRWYCASREARRTTPCARDCQWLRLASESSRTRLLYLTCSFGQTS